MKNIKTSYLIIALVVLLAFLWFLLSVFPLTGHQQPASDKTATSSTQTPTSTTQTPTSTSPTAPPSNAGGGGASVACTQEALICPDGSGVGRTGPDCSFTPCPNLGTYEGGLAKKDSSFRLMMAPPEHFPSGIKYSMPLVLEETSTVDALVGQQVRVQGFFTAGSTFKVEQLEAVNN